MYVSVLVTFGFLSLYLLGKGLLTVFIICFICLLTSLHTFGVLTGGFLLPRIFSVVISVNPHVF